MQGHEETIHGDKDGEVKGRRLALLSLTALGVVYGDISTSPLYAIRECFHGEYGIAPNPANVLGVLSLMFWALILVVSIKYLTFILLADNQGEGGVIALASLVTPKVKKLKLGRWMLVAIGLFGGALLYGDGAITPAISVLSAVEGIRIIAPSFQPYIIPLTIIILTLLFIIQSQGTESVGKLFGPITLVWLLAIATLGAHGIFKHPGILAAINPYYGASFLARNHLHGFLVLGAVFLVVTGVEAIYADMGHSGKRPIRLVWFYCVLPALLLNYFGQGALLIEDPGVAHHPFYSLTPVWFRIPMVLLATTATIIASQAVISGAFSLTRQAIQLGYLPRMKITHTSEAQKGQIYIAPVNWLLMLATISLVLGFQTSSKLAAAYGVAVTTTMTITSILFFVVAREKWGWKLPVAGSLVLVFLIVDLSFFGANITKIAHGAWFPLVVGAAVFAVFTTWKRGRNILAERLSAQTMPLDAFLESISLNMPTRVPGMAIFMAGNPYGVPTALLHNLKHNKVLHSKVAIMTIVTDEVPKVAKNKKVEMEDLGNSFYRILARYGFMEEPSVPEILALAKRQGIDFNINETSFFLGREILMAKKKPEMHIWRIKIFSFLSRNALRATTFYKIPARQVIELGVQIEI